MPSSGVRMEKPVTSQEGWGAGSSGTSRKELESTRYWVDEKWIRGTPWVRIKRVWGTAKVQGEGQDHHHYSSGVRQIAHLKVPWQLSRISICLCVAPCCTNISASAEEIQSPLSSMLHWEGHIASWWKHRVVRAERGLYPGALGLSWGLQVSEAMSLDQANTSSPDKSEMDMRIRAVLF